MPLPIDGIPANAPAPPDIPTWLHVGCGGERIYGFKSSSYRHFTDIIIQEHMKSPPKMIETATYLHLTTDPALGSLLC
jgi:hypothetical protein